MRTAWKGEPFEHEGRTVYVRPTPFSQPHPMICYGGGSMAAARRAARLDMPFFPQLRSRATRRRVREPSASGSGSPGLRHRPRRPAR